MKCSISTLMVFVVIAAFDCVILLVPSITAGTYLLGISLQFGMCFGEDETGELAGSGTGLRRRAGRYSWLSSSAIAS